MGWATQYETEKTAIEDLVRLGSVRWHDLKGKYTLGQGYGAPEVGVLNL